MIMLNTYKLKQSMISGQSSESNEEICNQIVIAFTYYKNYPDPTQPTIILICAVLPMLQLTALA